MRIAHRNRPGPYLPFITLADIAWQIIILFLLASTFVKNDTLKVTMPSAGSAGGPAKAVTVEASEGTLFVNRKPLLLNELEAEVGAYLLGAADDAQRAVVVRAADDLTFQRNADILYAIQKAGGIVVLAEEERSGDRREDRRAD